MPENAFSAWRGWGLGVELRGPGKEGGKRWRGVEGRGGDGQWGECGEWGGRVIRAGTRGGNQSSEAV